jgi:hypothetical protein
MEAFQLGDARMRYLILLAFISAFLTGCPGKKNEDVNPKTGFTPEHYAMVKEINEGFRDLGTAVALGVEGKTTGPNDKVSKMAELIKDAGCKEDNKDEPAEDFKTNFTKTYSVGASGSCPVRIHKWWDYTGDNQNRIWNFTHKIDSGSSDFRDTSVVESFAIHKGQLTVQNRTSSQKVDGFLNYSNFVVKGVGLLTSSLKLSSNYTTGRTGGGSLTFQLNSRKEFKAKVMITWHTGRATTYRINGYNVERNVVDDLFSSYGLEKIKDRSVNMLY